MGEKSHGDLYRHRQKPRERSIFRSPDWEISGEIAANRSQSGDDFMSQVATVAAKRMPSNE